MPSTFVAPLLSIAGGYHSPDIILLDPDTLQPIPQVGSADPELKPNREYPFGVVVHNSSPVNAPNTTVRFWYFPGGVGSAGTLLDVQTANVPASGQIPVWSAVPFPTAGPNQFRCAVVSIFNPQSLTCNIDAETATDVYDPDRWLVVGYNFSAWGNTHESVVQAGWPWRLPLAVEIPHGVHLPDPGPIRVEVEVEAFHVPADWEQTPEIAQMQTLVRALGGQSGFPLYLLPQVRHHLRPAELEIKLDVPHHSQTEPVPATIHAGGGTALAVAPRTRLHVRPGKAAHFTASGHVPRHAREGDVFLVLVTAHYPEMHEMPARAIEFAQVLRVVGESDSG